MNKYGLLLFVALYADAVFPTSRALCENYEYGGVLAREIIAHAACSQVYKDHNNPVEVRAPWAVHRFNYELAFYDTKFLHPGSFVMCNGVDNVVIIAFKGLSHARHYITTTRGGRNGPSSSTRVDIPSERLQALLMSKGQYAAKGKLGEFFNIERRQAQGVFQDRVSNVSMGWVHENFYKMILSCEAALFGILDSFKAELGNEDANLLQTKFILTGHDLGGALASMFACAVFQYLGLRDNHQNNISVITFGGAKFCWRATADYIANRMQSHQSFVRIVNIGRGLVFDTEDDIDYFVSDSWIIDRMIGLYDSVHLSTAVCRLGYDSRLSYESRHCCDDYLANFLEQDPARCRREWQ